MAMTDQADRTSEALQQLGDEVRELSSRWLPRARELRDFLERWERAWNTHDLDLLDTLLTEDIVCRDPAMFGQIVESRGEFRAFIETFFRAFPDVQFKDTSSCYLSPEGDGIALAWRMKGTFTGELTAWSKDPSKQPRPIAPTGKAFELEGVDLYRFRDGLLCDYSIVYDLLGFSAQVGLLG